MQREKIENALNVEVYQLFIPEQKNPVIIENTPENEKIRRKIQDEVIESVRNTINKTLKNLKEK